MCIPSKVSEKLICTISQTILLVYATANWNYINFYSTGKHIQIVLNLDLKVKD